MIKKILLSLVIVVALVMGAAVMTKPDYKAHYDLVKRTALKVIDHQVNSNPWAALFGPMVTMGALDIVDGYLKKNLLFYDHTFYTTGVLIYQDMFIPVSIGLFGQVWLTVDEGDLQRLAERPEVMQMLGVEDALRQIKSKLP